MGTLTGDQNRLPGYCDHKLPASCRLTSIPQCCACADERAHATSYSTYVDGVGFVPWGTRWQRYCWFCLEFWAKRVTVSGLRPAQTRIPEVPDQAEFLEKWYEFHRGYRIVKKEDGSEERVAVLGEEWRDVDPGSLPRTLDELRAGRAASEVTPQRMIAVVQETEESGPGLDDTLEQMFEAADAEDPPASRPVPQTQPTGRENARSLLRMTGYSAEQLNAHEPSSNVHAQVMVPTGSRNREYQARRITALRRELHRMRNGIERVITGLRDLGETVPEHAEATGRLAALGQRLDAMHGRPSREEANEAITSVNALTNTTALSQTDRAMANVQARVDEARREMEEARRNREQAASELDAAEQEFRTSQQRLQQLQREQRTAENYMRLFGTREEMVAAGDQYESPIGGMFSRAYERFHVAEDVRQQERTLRQVLEDESAAGGEQEAGRLAELEARERDVWGVPRQPTRRPAASEQEGVEEEPPGELEEYYALLRRQNWTQRPNADPAAETGDLPERPQSGTGPLFESNASRSAGPPSDPSPSAAAVPAHTGLVQTTSDWNLDAEQVLQRVVQSEQWADVFGRTPEEVDHVLARFLRNSLADNDQDLIKRMLEEPVLLWVARVPTSRLRRRRERGEAIRLRPDVDSEEIDAWVQNVEIMAEAFQMSAELRRRAPGLTGPLQLRMLYALQAGRRNAEDVERLEEMLRDRETLDLAARVHNTDHVALSGEGTSRRRNLDQHRRDAARQGDHSRQELDAQRRATHAFAIAAGRTAMQTSPSTLLERMAAQDEQTRAVYDRLRENGWAPQGNTPGERLLRSTLAYRPINLRADGYPSPTDDEDSETDSDREPEDVGLDAKDTGRPDAKTDEEMKVSMECRICYTQLAEIACLPCGHLVMCKWCSEQHSPVLQHDRTRPRRAAGCPVCRKGIRSKVRVFRV